MLLQYTREHWCKTNPADLPQGHEVARLVFSDELLRIRIEDQAAGGKIGIRVETIDFLPSRHDAGCCVSVYGFHGTHDAMGWTAGYCRDLRGVAVEPEAKAPTSSA